MAKRLVDIIPPVFNKKPKFVWKKNTSQADKPSLWPFSIVLVSAILLFNLISIGLNLNKNAELLIDSARSGINSLNLAKTQAQSTNFEESTKYFIQAQNEFNTILNLTWFLEGSINAPTVIAGSISKLSETGKNLSQVGQTFKKLPTAIIEANKSAIINPDLPRSNFTQEIFENAQILDTSIKDVEMVISDLKSLNLDLVPKKYLDVFNQNLADLEALNSKLKISKQYLDSALVLLGHKVPHKFLVLVQNNYESRATGGFPGSLAFFEINKGVIGDIKLVDVYALDGQLVTSKEEIPPEFKYFIKEMMIRDSNYTPDFEVSAKRLENLIQKANGPSATTVIGIDHYLIESLLSITGPVALPGYDSKITGENFNLVFTYLIEANKEQSLEDKNILSIFIPEFKKSLANVSDISKLANLFAAGIKQKHIQFYSKDDQLQATISQLGWSSSLKNIPNTHDFLMVTNTSIGGNKTDKYIKQRIIHSSKIKNKNTIFNTVTIRRHHSFKDSEEYKWQNILAGFGITQLKDEVRYVLGRGDNISAVKVYVPKNSVLLSANGADEVETHLDKDLDLTYFLFKMKVKPQETKQVTLTYKLRRDMGTGPAYTYRFLAEPQAGATNVVFQKKYEQKAPGFISIHNFKPYQYFPNTYKLDLENLYNYEQDFAEPISLGVIFGL